MAIVRGGLERPGAVAWPSHICRTSQERILTMHGRCHSAILSAVALASLGLGSGSGPARADVLSSLINGHEAVHVGNLVFDQFSYTPTGQMPSAANVNVNPIFD